MPHLHSSAPQATPVEHRQRGWLRPVSWIAALFLLLLLIASACLVQVRAGQAVVITRFGNPVRVLLEPGLAWRLPIPFEQAVPVTLTLHTTSSGLQDVGTKDGLRVIIQAYAAWNINPDPASIKRFLRAVRNQPDEAARQMRTLLGSALQISASHYELQDLVNTDKTKVRITELENHLATQIRAQLANSYGIALNQVGLERLTLPNITLAATIERMKAERETIATERTAEGRRKAAEIRAQAERDARTLVAEAGTKAARIEAEASGVAAAIYAKAYQLDPDLYRLSRSLDTLGALIGSRTQLFLSTDADPLRLLVEPPVIQNPQKPQATHD